MESCTQAANAARAKAAVKHKIAQYIADHYAMTREPLCQADILAKFEITRGSVNRSIRELQKKKKIHCVALAGDTEREDVAANVKMYAPITAPMMGVVPVATGNGRGAVAYPAYEGKPKPLRERRPKQERYRGERGEKYVPPFVEMTASDYDLRAHQKLAMLAR